METLNVGLVAEAAIPKSIILTTPVFGFRTMLLIDIFMNLSRRMDLPRVSVRAIAIFKKN